MEKIPSRPSAGGSDYSRLEATRMFCILYDMRTVSVRELPQNPKRVLEHVEHGETVEVTKRRRVIGRCRLCVRGAAGGFAGRIWMSGRDGFSEEAPSASG